MGYDFINAHGEGFGFNQRGWPGIYELALRHGWEPTGTAPSIEPEIRVNRDIAELIVEASPEPDGSYFGNDWQVVIGPDALGLAAALERAMPELPDEDLCPVRKLNLFDGRGRPIEFEVLADNAGDDPKLFWSGPESKKHLQKFINFCRRGGFTIG